MTIVLGETGDHIIEIAPMIFNARLLMVPKGAEGLYWDYGWCYRDIPQAVIAFTAWNPLTEDEPPGWHKRPNNEIRRAPHRDPNAPVRCQHGKYENCDYIGCEYHDEPQRLHDLGVDLHRAPVGRRRQVRS